MTTDTISTPPLPEDRKTYGFIAVIDGVRPGKRLEYWAHSIEEAQAMVQAEYAHLGARAVVQFIGIVPDWLNKKQYRYNIPTESQRLQAELEPITEAPRDEQDALAND